MKKKILILDDKETIDRLKIYFIYEKEDTNT